MLSHPEDATALVSRKRGRASNRRHGETFRQTVLTLVRQHYSDFGPTLAAEKLAARHGLRSRVETLRQWMIADGLWMDRRHRLPSPHQPRRRRDCLGELVQIDGSEHAWFEDRGQKCTLLAFVDDATSRLMQLRFVASESTFDYFRATRTYLETHGKPVAFYSDKHSIFRVNTKERGRRGRDPVRSRADGAEHRHHLRQQPAGQGPGGARVRHVAGPAGQGAAAGGDIDDRSGECLAAWIHRQLQRAFRPRAGERQRSAPAADARQTIWTRSWRGVRSGRSRAISPCTTTG